MPEKLPSTDCRDVAKHITAALHEITCVREVYDELFIVPATLNGSVYSACWHDSARLYFTTVERAVKSLLRVQHRINIVLTLYSEDDASTLEWWCFFISRNYRDSQKDVAIAEEEEFSAMLDQITASAAFLPVLPENVVFKVSLSISEMLDTIPRNCVRLKTPERTMSARGAQHHDNGNSAPLRSFWVGSFKIEVEVGFDGDKTAI